MTRKATVHIFITLIAALLYLPFLGKFHLFDWDELNFAEAAREMIVSGDYSRVQIHFEPFWEKPPLFIWLQVLSMKVFGITEFAARLPNALCGIITLNILYHYGRRIIGHFSGIFWVLAYAGSLAPTLYFKSGIIDPVFNLFIFLSIYQLFCAEKAKLNEETPRIHYLLLGLFLGLATLTKGPVAILIVGIVGLVRLLFNFRYVWPGVLNIIVTLISLGLVISAWVVPEIVVHGKGFFSEFWKYQLVLFQGQIEWHNQPWFYHIVVLFFLCFPSSILAIPHLLGNSDFSGTEKLYNVYMRATFWVVLIIFNINTTKIIHYSSMCWYPLAWFAGNSMYRVYTNRGRIAGWLLIPMFIGILVLGIVAVALPVALNRQWPLENLSSQIADKGAKAILMQGSLAPGFEWIIGLIFVLACAWWAISFFRNSKMNATGLFVITALFAMAIWSFILPMAESRLQGPLIKDIQSHAGKAAYLESWGFKTYAIPFYSLEKPSNYKGPWEKDKPKFTMYLDPQRQARLSWCMDRVMDKPVYVYTRVNYQPDYYFSNKFKRVGQLGQYMLWQRKDVSKPDIRIKP